MRMSTRWLSGAALLALWTTGHAWENFEVAVYARAQEVVRMEDREWLEREWQRISSAVQVDKVYLEVHRDGHVPSDAALEAARAFFAERGVKTAGGITYTIDEGNRFETFSYSNPEHRRRVQAIAENAARHFDEVILDDFFFTSTKSEHDLRARGSRSWTQYRLEVMTEAGRNLVMKPARRVNPRVKVIIKYPNWYEHFQGLGFNLETGPAVFDGIYTGTETRDAVRSAQHLQPYHGYSIMRYFENLAPGRNGGGWVDPFGSSGYDRYAEQLWMTLWAKSGAQVVLFDWGSIQRPLGAARAAGQGAAAEIAAAAAARAFAAADRVAGALGRPVALRSYRPHHAVGEDHLQSFLGMIGLPMEILPHFPEEDAVVLLTEHAAADRDIVARIEKHVRSGRSVVITSGLLKALEPRGIGRIAEIGHTGRVALASQFMVGYGPLVQGEKPVLVPQLAYRTNDSWELVSAIDGDNGWPLLHDADYAGGHLYVLVVPENFADFYHYPAVALNEIRRVLTPHLPVRIEGPSKVGLFAYDNDTFIVHNFRDEVVEVGVVVAGGERALADIASGEAVAVAARAPQGRAPAQPGPASAGSGVARITLPAHGWRALRIGR
jgi:hypothetical protein|nr:MAG: hypothetical protein DIU62_04735 [Pseudomonadota bacterium]